LHRRVLVAAPLACAACTFAGLGNYDVETCAQPTGTTETVQEVTGTATDLTFSTVAGETAIGAFAVQSSSCVQGVGTSGYLSGSCAFFAGLSLAPRQPWIVPLGAGYGATAVATTAPCTQGALYFQYSSPTASGTANAPCEPMGAALPSVAPLSAQAASSPAIVAWYETAFSTRADPLAACAGAQPVSLVVALANVPQQGDASLGQPITLSTEATSVRPPAMATTADASAIVVASPDGNGASVWLVDASLAPRPSLSVPALAGARAVAVATADDDSGRVAIAAEIGCAPQSIALVVGTLADGFHDGTVVAEARGGAAIQPSVAWVASEGGWIVSWVASEGGAHVLARRFDANGAAVGSTVDPGTSATGAAVTGGGEVFAYVPTQGGGSFVNTSLGCAE